MYISEHGHTGVIITTLSVITLGLPLGLPLGLFLAFVSHFLWDYINEYNYGNLKKAAYAQSYSILLFFIALFFLWAFELYIYIATYILGYLAGNLPDIIDKKITNFKEARPKSKRFSCHNGESFLTIGKWKLGYPTIYNLDKTEQGLAQFISTIALIILTIYII